METVSNLCETVLNLPCFTSTYNSKGQSYNGHLQPVQKIAGHYFQAKFARLQFRSINCFLSGSKQVLISNSMREREPKNAGGLCTVDYGQVASAPALSSSVEKEP